MEETMKDYERELEASFRKISEGDVIKGTVIDVNEEEVTLDLKYYTQGIIKAKDMSDDPAFAILEEVHPGDELEATVVKMDDGQGHRRYTGYMEAMKKAGLPTKDENIIWIDTEDVHHPEYYKEKLLTKLPGCSAFFCYKIFVGCCNLFSC